MLLAVLAILPALYAILPRSRQLGFRLRVTWVDWTLICIVAATLLGFEFHDFLVSRYRIFWHRLPLGVTTSNLSITLITCLVLIIGLRIKFAKLDHSKFGKFTRLSQELLWSGAHPELVALINENQVAMFAILREETIIGRLIRELEPLPPFSKLQEFISQVRDGVSPPKPKTLDKILDKLLKNRFRTKARSIVWALSKWDQHQEYEEELVRAVLLSDGFAEAVVRFQPYLGLSMLELWGRSHEASVFLERYMRAVMTLRDSVFYRELGDNQNMDGNRYRIAPTNRLLKFFLADSKVATEHSIYKPVGDFALALLDDLSWDPQVDPYNRALRNFEQDSRRGDPIHATKHFFEIMVLEALHQDDDWHMWLYYFASMVEKMARNSRIIDPLSSPTQEFPNQYCFLIYEVVTALRDFIMAADDLPSNENLKMRFGPSEHENNNIAKSSIFCLSTCMRAVLLADNLGQRFQNYIAEIILRIYFELMRSENLKDYASVIAYKLKTAANFSQHEDLYLERLEVVLSENAHEFMISFDEKHFEELSTVLFGYVIS
jgi:hypothetical protein